MIVGLDMGGTHIDGVIVSEGSIIDTIKTPRYADDLFESIWMTLEKLLMGHDISKIKRINLSTTVSTNAIVEGKTSPVGMIIQSGPGMPHDFLACGCENSFISGYIDHRGKVVEDLKLEEIEDVKIKFKEKNIKSCAIVTKFSTRNFDHELRIKDLLEDGFSHITMGHTLSGRLNFPRRVFTSYLNAATYHTFRDFSTSIQNAMEQKGADIPLFILKADGGTTSLQEAGKKPVETILSGPAASFMGLNALLNTQKDALLLDIGGTTTDIFFLADGVPLFEPIGIEIHGYKTLIRAIYSFSIGLGGDSSIDIVNHELKIGPKRHGPPYALGGPKPTPSDAMIALGLMEAGHRQMAIDAIKGLGKSLNLSVEDTANKILDTMSNMIKAKVDELLVSINSKPVYTVRELLHGKKIEPQLINIIGGPANCLAAILEKKFNLPCYCPKHYGVANAIGAAMAKITQDIILLGDTSRGILSSAEFGFQERISKDFTLEDMRSRALELLKRKAMELGAKEDEIEAEIVEESSFNMVDGFFTKGKNMRVEAQIRPGLAGDLLVANPQEHKYSIKDDKYDQSKK